MQIQRMFQEVSSFKAQRNYAKKKRIIMLMEIGPF